MFTWWIWQYELHVFLQSPVAAVDVQTKRKEKKEILTKRAKRRIADRTG